jgi:hypothetical protein
VDDHPRPKHEEDEDGLSQAYAASNNLHVSGTTLYVSGTHPNSNNRVSDYFTDLEIPVPGLLRSTWRYNQARRFLVKHPEVDTIVGHSLGGAIAQELSVSDQVRRVRVYGAPTLFGRDKVTYYRHPGDPVSISNRVGEFFGRRSRNTAKVGNPHSYAGFAHPR